MRAVMSRESGSCALDDVALRAIGANDVRVRIDASGICHSDISVCDGSMPHEFPVVLGHEGAGTVTAVGPDVGSLRAGDRVVLSAVAPCGACWSCVRGRAYLCREVRSVVAPPFVDGSRPIPGVSGLGTLCDEIVVDARAAVRVTTDLPADLLATIGCAVLTGGGALLNIAAPRTGDTVMVIGTGGVGLAATMAAAATGASLVATIDPSAAARERALACGAHVALDPIDADETAATVLELTGGRGVDATVDCVGWPASFELAWRATRRGGHIVVVGVPPLDQRVPLGLADLARAGTRISGCVYGSSVVQRDIPMYVSLAESGRYPLELLVGSTIALDGAPAVILAGGGGAGRTIVVNG